MLNFESKANIVYTFISGNKWEAIGRRKKKNVSLKHSLLSTEM